MLKLFFYFTNETLKVRRAQPDEVMESCVWEDTIEFAVAKNAMMMMTWTSLLPDLKPKYAQSLLRLVSARYPVSTRYEMLRELCPRLVFSNQDDEWVFFGGSFHPWHAGHQACLNLLDENKTCLVLPDRNPYKQLREVEPVVGILELSSQIRFKTKQFLVPTFLLQSEPNPTVDWIRLVKKHFPTKKLSLLIGHDNFVGIKSWTSSDELLPLLDTLYVVSRLEVEESRAAITAGLQEIAPDLKISFLGRHEFENLSSTALRGL